MTSAQATGAGLADAGTAAAAPPAARLAAGRAAARLLPERRLSGPLPWLIAIMMFLMVLGAALGLGLGNAAAGLQHALAGRVTVQIIEGDPARREAQAAAAVAQLRAISGVQAVTRVDDAAIRTLLEPWLGDAVAGRPGSGDGADLPLPAMIDVDLAEGDQWRMDAIRRTLATVAPAARIDDHAASLAPLNRLIAALVWLAGAIVLLLAAATAFVVVLATRSALETHRATIDVLHLMGATDRQVAQLFQRRIALDALFGGLAGLAAAIVVILLLGRQLHALQSELAETAGLWPLAWALLVLLPVAGAGLAMLATRVTVLRALKATP